MGKLKPFLFGAIFGGGIAFVALQYHLVRSEDGFRVVPRTPQPSVGLAYADIRNWGAEEWTDRSELARAMVANGSTDLVATSVSGNLLETISSEGSTLDKLRGLMNEAEDGLGSSSTFDDSGFLTIPPDNEKPANSQDLFSIPFPQDARRKSDQSTAQQDSFTKSTPTNVARRELPSIDDILRSGGNGIADMSQKKPVLAEPMREPPKEPYSPFTAAEETQALEDLLFDNEPALATRREPNRATTRNPTPGLFEEITSAVQQRAEDSLNRTINDSANSMDHYVRDRVQETIPGSISSMFQQDALSNAVNGAAGQQKLSAPLQALQDGFDPFSR